MAGREKEGRWVNVRGWGEGIDDPDYSLFDQFRENGDLKSVRLRECFRKFVGYLIGE